MNQIIEFVGNNPLLFVAFGATLGMLLWTEWTRFSSSATTLSPYAATQLVNGGDAVFVDVRDEKEYKSGHLLNARNFPVAKLDERMHEIEKLKDRGLVVYCDKRHAHDEGDLEAQEAGVREAPHPRRRPGRLGEGEPAGRDQVGPRSDAPMRPPRRRLPR